MDRFLEELAAATPTPGGGSASCYVAATGAALVEMCAGLGARKGREDAQAVADAARSLRSELLRQAVADGAAFELVLAAHRLPKDRPDRPGAIAAALREAARSPLRILDLVLDLCELILRAEAEVPVAARSDWESAVVFARAAADVAERNVRVNLEGAAEGARLERQLLEKVHAIAHRLPQL